MNQRACLAIRAYFRRGPPRDNIMETMVNLMILEIGISAAFSLSMQTIHAPIPLLALFPGAQAPQFSKTLPQPVVHDSSPYAIEEINAYAAIRDDLLAEAEEVPTRAKLESVTVANNFVETCLQSAHPAYQAQNLRGADADRERKRCGDVKNRVAELRAGIPIGYPV